VNLEGSADLDSIAHVLGVKKEVRDRARELIDLLLGRKPNRMPKPRMMAAAALYISSHLCGSTAQELPSGNREAARGRKINVLRHLLILAQESLRQMAGPDTKGRPATRSEAPQR